MYVANNSSKIPLGSQALLSNKKKMLVKEGRKGYEFQETFFFLPNIVCSSPLCPELHQSGKKLTGNHGFVWLELMLVCSMEDVHLEGCQKRGVVLWAKMRDGRMEIWYVMLLGGKLHYCSHQANQKVNTVQVLGGFKEI